MQLSEGDFGWASEQGYPAFLAHFGNLELKLAIAAEGAKAVERAKVKRLSFAKESGAASTQFNWVFGTKFMKAAGCTQARTVSHECLFPREGGGGTAVKLPALTKKVFLLRREKQEFKQEATKSAAVLALPRSADVDERILQAWPEEGRMVAEAVHPEVFKEVIAMFSRYFASDLTFVFPLIVYRNTALGLDFSTTRTWCMFDSSSRSGGGGGGGGGIRLSGAPKGGRLEDRATVPVGAVSWRIRRHALGKVCKDAGVAVAIEPVAEVLFIAVWEQERSDRYGGDLVDAVTTNALEQGVRLLYVEIGEEQPKAQDFWRKQGFEPLDPETGCLQGARVVSDAQIRFFDQVCFRFSDTVQWVKRL